METPLPDSSDPPSFIEDDKTKFDDARKRQKGQQRWLTEERWQTLVSILRDGIRPRETRYRTVLKAKSQYYWDNEINQLRRKSNRVIVVQPSRIFETLATEHKKQHRRKPVFPDYISENYTGITRFESNIIIKLCRKCRPPPRPNIGERDNGGDPLNASLESGPLSGGQSHAVVIVTQAQNNGGDTLPVEHDPTRRSEVDNESQLNMERNLQTAPRKTKLCIEWLKRMRDREWPEPLARSRYKYIISGLCTILEAARPANAYYSDSKARDEVCSASYASADLLRLSMQEATVELAKSEGMSKPIFIPQDTAGSESLKTIEGILKQLEHYDRPLDVQDLILPHNMPSAEKRPIKDVLSRFAAGCSPEKEPPINILNLDCPEQRVEPDCVVIESMNFLSYLKPDAMRSMETSSSIWLKCEKWRLLGQGGSGSMTHQDHCGFWTWVKIEEGEKIWLMCQLSDHDREAFATDGCSFTGGQWFYVWLGPGDILVMPPGTVHAVFTPVNTLCAGGNVWSQRHMGETMKSIAFEDQYPDVTNDDEVPQLSGLLEQASRRMNRKDAAAVFGGEEQVGMFSKYYKEYKERRRSTTKRSCKTNIQKSAKRIKTPQIQTAHHPPSGMSTQKQVKQIETWGRQAVHPPGRRLTRSSAEEIEA